MMRVKTAIGIHPTMFEFRSVNRGRSVWLLREHDPDDKQAGEAPVVVRDGESPLHGEGEQFIYVCRTNYLTEVR